MTYTVLDIGAGQKFFAKRLRKRNPTIPMLILCGEPDWSLGRRFYPFRIASSEKIARLQETNRTGIYRMRACYEDFNLPDASLDLVTLNCPHPLCGPSKDMLGELERCLKPGGLFFSSHVSFDLGQYPESFTQIAAGPWSRNTKTAIDVSMGPLPEHVVRVFPKSWNMVSNIQTHNSGSYLPGDMSYLYSDGIRPCWRLLQKPE